MTPRAPSLPPEQRRAEILRAARPLLLEHGGRFTTRQVAEAAGIAEGTLFRVFPTKRDLAQAVVGQLLDPAELCAYLDGIDRTLPLEARVAAVIGRIQADIGEISAVFAALFTLPSEDGKPLGHPDHKGQADHAEHERRAALLHTALVGVLEPDADRLACSVDEAASIIRSMAFATSHPHLSDRRVTDPDLVTRLLLGGLVSRGRPPATWPAVPAPTSPTSTPPAPPAPSTQESPC